MALLLAVAVAALASVAFGYLTLRTKGAYFLLIGFSFTEVVRRLYTQIDVIGANSGIVGISRRGRWTRGIPLSRSRLQ